MRLRNLLLCCVLLPAVLGSMTPSAWASWTNNQAANINTTPLVPDQALAVAIDASENVVAAGFTRTAINPDRHFAVAKFGRDDGSLSWSYPGDVGEARAVAVDGNGDVIAAGFVNNPGSIEDFFVVKLSGVNGMESWRRTITGGGTGGQDQALAVVVDASGDVIAAGFTTEAASGRDITVVKLAAADGSDVWPRRIIGGAGQDRALALALAGTDIVVTGFQRTTNKNDIYVMKLDGSSGADSWIRPLINGNQNEDDEGRAVAVDGSGDVLVAGVLRDDAAAAAQLAVFKFAGATGVEQWRRKADGKDANGIDVEMMDDSANAVAVNDAGDVFVAGRFVNKATAEDGVVVKLFGTSGNEAWRRAVHRVGDGPAAGQLDELKTLAVDSDGDVIAAGTFSNGSAKGDGIIVKLHGADGDETWRHVFDGANSSADPPYDALLALALDATGSPAAAGFIDLAATGEDFMVVRLAKNNGTFPCGNAVTDAGESCDNGNANNDCATCSLTCQPVQGGACGDSMFNVACEQCDGTDPGEITPCREDCTLQTPSDLLRRCYEGIAKAGRKFLSSRLKTLEACRNDINRGQRTILFAACPDAEGISQKLVSAGGGLRKSIAASCGVLSGGDLGTVLGLCPNSALCLFGPQRLVRVASATIDDLVNCYSDFYAATVDDLLKAEYGR